MRNESRFEWTVVDWREPLSSPLLRLNCSKWGRPYPGPTIGGRPSTDTAQLRGSESLVIEFILFSMMVRSIAIFISRICDRQMNENWGCVQGTADGIWLHRDSDRNIDRYGYQQKEWKIYLYIYLYIWAEIAMYSSVEHMNISSIMIFVLFLFHGGIL